MPISEATKNRVDMLSALVGFASVVLVGIIGYQFASLSDDLDRIEKDCTDTRIIVHANSQHAKQHEVEAAYWKKVIDENRRLISEIYNKPTARADPFTGRDGKKLRERIEALELKAAR